ncbi:S46 family peptidase [Sunxiuqinia dokdonensis]|uniref:Dipeptidyl-peptidase n=1 Tax=Sunxiuqinia dokdonensis TaxID=1409788 RepID=A0A0L8VEW5_9BACT|nr:S46 family peptidase [Sunxiuqinia dokdonensis]KOH47020.1 peptidase S46 [Sunxiuqinia dokdonensis]
MKRIFVVIVGLSLLFQGSATADEGMWLPSLVHKLNIGEMQEMGMELSADDIYSINNSSLKDAIVAIDRGSCTGELISAQGLMLTNHHCGFDEIQTHSSVEHDYLQDGFWAKSLEEELPNPGKTVSFLVRVEDVTDQLLEGLDEDLDFSARNAAIQRKSFEIQKEATDDTHYDARVQSLFEGNRFYLFVYETFRDVRLVGAPPKSIGKFGGDTDNWMWPRHTGDFALFRVYAGPDGKPANYSEENIPYQPKHHLPISLKGYEEGDFAMVLGYPGSTNRYKSSFGIEYTMTGTNEARINAREKKLEILKQYMSSGQKERIQYASKHARSSNYYKYSIGQNKGLNALQVIEKKKTLEEKFTNWVNEDEGRKEKYAEALSLIESAYEDTRDEQAYEYLVESMVRGPEIFYFSYGAKGLFEALKQGNTERIAANAAQMKAELDDFFKDYNASTDAKIAGALMSVFQENVVSTYHPDFFKEIRKKYKGDFMAYAEKMFDKTVFANQEELEAFLDNPKLKTLEKDMAFQSALDIFDMMSILGAKMSETKDDLLTGRRLFVAGLMEMEQDRKFYPDANSTMRLTYGTVGDYVPRDGVHYSYYTTLKGYIEKEIPGDDEFDVPAKLKELYYANDFGQYADKDGTLHTCFTTNNDITGGNSGSPVINGKGELIGVAFDGNWEAMSGDIAFEPELQKCINVDIRFVLWTIDKFAGATNLIEEMTIVK